MAQVAKIGVKADKEKEDSRDRIKPVFHKIQPIWGTNSLVVVLPKQLTGKLGLHKGDYAKFSINDNKLILEKV